MSEKDMVGRVARAIYAKVYGWTYTDLDDLEPWLAVAREAIKEMREPTPFLMAACLDAAEPYFDADAPVAKRKCVSDVIQAYFDAASSEPSQ